MSTRPPAKRTVVILLGFVAACSLLTIYLWVAFGGPVALSPQGYRVEVPFADATSLADEADVRIAGVNVGKVKAKRLDMRTHMTVAELEIDASYAPRPADTRATLRQKSLLGEVYLELTPGSPSASKLHDGGRLPAAQVQRSVRVDEVLRTFDPATRRSLSTWLSEQGRALQGGGASLNAALSRLYPLAQHGDDVLRVLDEEHRATTALIADGGTAIGALTEREGQLRRLVRAGREVFATTAARDAQLADTFRALPPFLSQTRATSARVARFSQRSLPLVRQLRPAARRLSPVLEDLAAVVPSLRRVTAAVRPLSRAAVRGVPALDRTLDDTTPLLARLKPWLGGLVPVVDDATTYRREIAGFAANVAATTQATLPAAGGGKPLHYARGALPINAESLGPVMRRLASSQSNPYPKAGDSAQLGQGLPAFASYLCSTAPFPALSDLIEPTLRKEIADFYFTDEPSGPPCRDGGQRFPHLEALP